MIYKYLIAIVLVSQTKAWRPCPELSPLLKFPCRCNVEAQSTDKEHLEVSIDCDGVVFNEDQPQFPYGAPIVSYWQRDSGQQRLTLQVSYNLLSTLAFTHELFYIKYLKFHVLAFYSCKFTNTLH